MMPVEWCWCSGLGWEGRESIVVHIYISCLWCLVRRRACSAGESEGKFCGGVEREGLAWGVGVILFLRVLSRLGDRACILLCRLSNEIISYCTAQAD